jgi:malate dehydrogenase
MLRRIALFGPGRVGESAAHLIARRDLCRELVLIGIDDAQTRGIALDIQESAPAIGFDTRVTGGADPALCEGAELIILTAGIPRAPGMSREDVLRTNQVIIDSLCDAVRRHAPDALVLVVSNPVDLLTHRVRIRTGLPRSRVIGQAGLLDASRMASFIAQTTGLSVQDVRAMVIGGHGDTMLPLPRFSSVSGVPVTSLLDQGQLDEIMRRTREGGGEILALRGNASAYDAPAAAIASMVDAIAHDRRRLLPGVAVLDGEYGEYDVALGVPLVLGREGIERIVELPLDTDEAHAFRAACQHARQARAPESP